MAQEQVTRRLAAILAADVVGYSRLMGDDEMGTLQALKAHRRSVVDPTITSHNGRIVKTTGDGLLAEFASVIDAVSCAVEMQRGMATRNADIPENDRIVFRVGINVGDIIFDGDDIFGDGVNVAARLEALCEPGGLCISRSANDQIRDKLSVAFNDLGEQTVKNISHTIGVFGLAASDIAGIADDALTAGQIVQAVAPTLAQQEIRYCTATDGAMIAYATVGSGPPLVKAPHWLTHLEFEWESPVWSHLNREMSADHTLVRFDQRGNGLSDWGVEDISFDAFVRDMETVVEAAGVDRFPLLGISQGCSMSVAYTLRNPERVSCLILYGGFARGTSHRGQATREQAEATVTMIKHGWGQDNPAFRQFFTTGFIPEATPEQMDWFNDLQKISASPENAARLRETLNEIEVTSLLAEVKVPTLVLHCRGDAIVPFDEGRRMAAMIPGAKFFPLEGNNHLMLENEPAWPKFLEEVRAFLKETS